MIFRNKKILIGITGGIAAYKIPYLVRTIKTRGGEVKTILTGSGEQFVTKTTLATLSEEPVAYDVFDSEVPDKIQHIDLARWADCFVIAPATANIFAKAAHGIADDILSTIIVSYKGSILFAPAMHDEMWKNCVTQDNIKKLLKQGHEIVPPEFGSLASDSVGMGRLAELETIEQAIIKKLNLKLDLTGKKILITAGRTEEAIDPIRYISNHSSGKMGAALAEAAAERGAAVTVIAGIRTVPFPGEASIIEAPTTHEMAKAVKRELNNNDVLLMAAAVADYRPKKSSKEKIKKGSANVLSLELETTEDILGSIKERKKNTFVAGFSVETQNEIANSRKKLTEKNLDLIIVNNPFEPGAGFDVDTNRVTLLETGKKAQHLPLLSKRDVADRIFDRIAARLRL